jgi:hypothetical protein
VSTLTKILVVLLVVFSIAYTSMTVAIVARTPNWKETAEKYKEHARIASTNLRHAHAASAARLATADDTLRGHRERVSELSTQLAASQLEADAGKAEIERIKVEKSNVEALNRGLLAQLEVAEAARTEYRQQRDDLEARNLNLERRNVDLNDRVNELTAQTAVLMEQRRQYEQQLNILRRENEKLARAGQQPAGTPTFEQPQGAAMPDVVAMSPVASTPIRGSVLEVAGSLVTINVGSADGVRKGMIFVLHRGDEYVGDVEISLVDPEQSAGRIVRSTSAPIPGDAATDERGLVGSRG